MRFEDALGRTERSELSQVEAAELLGVSERMFRRWRGRYREEGVAGLSDRRLGPSPRRASMAELERMPGLYRDLYRCFTMKHFHEQLGKRHRYTLGYTVTKLHLQRAGLVTPARSRSAHRKKRPRRPRRWPAAIASCKAAAASSRRPGWPSAAAGTRWVGGVAWVLERGAARLSRHRPGRKSGSLPPARSLRARQGSAIQARPGRKVGSDRTSRPSARRVDP